MNPCDTNFFLSYQFRKTSILATFLLLLSLFFVSCSNPNSFDETKTNITRLIENGDILHAKAIIKSELKKKNISNSEVYSLDSLFEICSRIKIDFSLNEEQVRTRLFQYFPELDNTMMQNWEISNKLEMKIIDGEKRYFKNSVGNLFRLDKEAFMKRSEIEGIPADSLKIFCLNNSKSIIGDSDSSGTPCLPVKMKLNYTIRLKPNAVPDGKIVKCWMPYPREENLRQRGIKLVSTNPSESTLSPKENLQRTIYLEKKAIKDEWTIFETEIEITGYSQFFRLKPEKIIGYDRKSSLFISNTLEQKPHILFTDEIKKLSSRIIGNETNPLLKVKKIFTWINDSIPWASALEYSIIPNIPEYVVKYRHGDCGMKTLLFMTLARYEGIPVKWQSGWMLHPREVNLHDWCEVYFENLGWVPVDQSFGIQNVDNEDVKYFYMGGIDSYRFIVNDDISSRLSPNKKYLRSEPYDFQRGELEWEGGNIYFDKWNWNMKVEYSEFKTK